MQVDPRTNTLIITRPAEPVPARSRSLIDALDRAQPQVEIEARIVQTNKNYARALGVQWGFSGRVDPALGNTTNLAFPNNGSLHRPRRRRRRGPRAAPTTGAADRGQPAGVRRRPAPSAWRSARSTARSTSTSRCRRSRARGNGRLLSTPRVTTQNNVEAEITQGVQIPIQTVANNTVTVSFKDAALTLKVTPQITAANTVIMKISLENAHADFSRQVNGIPPINTQRANTHVLVSDGQTTVIGGIYTSNSTVAERQDAGAWATCRS